MNYSFSKSNLESAIHNATQINVNGYPYFKLHNHNSLEEWGVVRNIWDKYQGKIISIRSIGDTVNIVVEEDY